MRALRKKILLWWIMLALIVLGIGSAPISIHYNETANYHYRMANPDFYKGDENDSKREYIIRDWHAQMERKYRRAAFLPWLPVAPDPPEPK